MQEDLCSERPFGGRKGYSNFAAHDGKPVADVSSLSDRGTGLRRLSLEGNDLTAKAV